MPNVRFWMRIVRWCIRLTRLTLLCEVIKYCLCKLTVLPGARLHKLTLHYSRAAEPSHPGTRFPGLSVRITECRPRAQQGLGARSARGGRWLVPAVTDVAAVTVISAGPAAQTDPCPKTLAPIPLSCFSSSSFSLSLSLSLSFDPSVCLSSFSLFSCSFCCLSLDFRVREVARLHFWQCCTPYRSRINIPRRLLIRCRCACFVGNLLWISFLSPFPPNSTCFICFPTWSFTLGSNPTKSQKSLE